MTRLPLYLHPGFLAALAISAVLWLAILAVVPWMVAIGGAAACLLGFAAGWRWCWNTGHAVPEEWR